MEEPTDDPSTKTILVQQPETDEHQPRDDDNPNIPKGVSKTWLDKYNQISAYQKFPTPNETLNQWIRNQKYVLKNTKDPGKTWAWKIDKLKDLGFDIFPMNFMEFSPGNKHNSNIPEGVTKKWLHDYRQVLAFMKTNDGRLPMPTTEYRLNNWLHGQKNYLKKHDTPRSEVWSWKLRKMKDIGFRIEKTESKRNEDWEDRFASLVAYKEEYGSCKVKQSIDKSLYSWHYNQGKTWNRLTSERQRMLQGIGFSAGMFVDERASSAPTDNQSQKTDNSPSLSLEQRWNNKFNELKMFKRMHGHCLVPASNRGLGCWVVTQRAAHRRKNLPKDRCAQLEALNFVWKVNGNKRRVLEKQLEDCGAFRNAHAATTAPAKDITETIEKETNTPCGPRGKKGPPTSAKQSRKNEPSAAGAPRRDPFRIASLTSDDCDQRADGPVCETPVKTQKKARKRILFAEPRRKRAHTVSVVAKGSSDQPARATTPVIPLPLPKRRMSLWADVPILQPEPWNGINPLQNPDPYDNLEL